MINMVNPPLKVIIPSLRPRQERFNFYELDNKIREEGIMKYIEVEI